MNKKKRTQYLLLAVVLIYTAVIARFFMLSDDDGYEIPTTDAIAFFKPTLYTAKENFTIRNDYRDPFLGTLAKGDQIKSSTAPKTSEKKKETYFPTITYLGIISDASSSKKVVSLKINTKEYVTREGSVLDSVRVISGSTKELLVSYKGKRKRITISN